MKLKEGQALMIINDHGDERELYLNEDVYIDSETEDFLMCEYEEQHPDDFPDRERCWFEASKEFKENGY